MAPLPGRSQYLAGSDFNGNPKAMIAVIRDISERKRAEDHKLSR